MTSLPASQTEVRGTLVDKRILAWPRALSLNPMPGMVYDGMERSFGWRVVRFNYLRAIVDRYSILHVSFPNVAFRNRSRIITLARYFLSLATLNIAKVMRRRVAWTVHNLADHEGYHPRLEARFMAKYTTMVDFVIHLSEAGREAAIARYPRLADKPSATIPHPHYGNAIGERVERAAALTKLGLPADCRLILAFGVVRRYKNLLQLMRAFTDLPGGDTRLLVAGSPLDGNLADAMRGIAAADGRLTLKLHSIAEPEIATLFGAATLVVAPYLDILNSGTAFMSLTYGRPIMVPDRGAMKELQRHVGATWVKLFDAPLTPLTLGDALHWAGEPRPPTPDLDDFAPERIAAAYDKAMSGLI